MDENKPAGPTPEQLLKLLDAEMNASRQRRAKIQSGRRGIQIAGIMVIVVGAAVALWILMFMLDDRRPARGGNVSDTTGQGVLTEPR